MKLVIASTLVAVGILSAAPAFASKELATKNACFACHAVDKKLVGPSFPGCCQKIR